MNLLIIEDDPMQLELLTRLLEKEGFSVTGLADGADGLYALRQGAFDLAIVDRMLPGLDGITLLKAYRKGGGKVPILLLTALGAVQDRVVGLDAGADDYLTKPYAPQELLARVRALLRRPAALQEVCVQFSDLRFDSASGTLHGPNGDCELSKREAAMLTCFLNNPNQVLSRSQLLAGAWGGEADVEERNIDNFVFLVRRRLQNVGSQTAIVTVRGFGYRLEDAKTC